MIPSPGVTAAALANNPAPGDALQYIVHLDDSQTTEVMFNHLVSTDHADASATSKTANRFLSLLSMHPAAQLKSDNGPQRLLSPRVLATFAGHKVPL